MWGDRGRLTAAAKRHGRNLLHPFGLRRHGPIFVVPASRRWSDIAVDAAPRSWTRGARNGRQGAFRTSHLVVRRRLCWGGFRQSDSLSMLAEGIESFECARRSSRPLFFGDQLEQFWPAR